MTVEKPKPKQLLRPITTGPGSAMNQSQFLAFTCNSLEAREKSRVHGTIGFVFASHWLKNWRDSFKPITKRSNCNHVITFESHLKTALNKKTKTKKMARDYETSALHYTRAVNKIITQAEVRVKKLKWKWLENWKWRIWPSCITLNASALKMCRHFNASGMPVVRSKNPKKL